MQTWIQTAVTTVIMATGLMASAEPARGAETWMVVVSPDNSFNTLFAKDGRAILETQIVTWGPKWAWVGSPSSRERAVGGNLRISGPLTIAEEKVTMACDARKSGEQTVTYKYELSAERDVPVTTLVNSLTVNSMVSGEIVVTKVNGDPQTLPIPERRLAVPDVAAELTFKLKDAGDVVLTLDPPCRIQAENGATRVELAHDRLKAGKTVVTLTFRFPGPVSFVGSNEEQEKFTRTIAGPEWFTFQGSNDVGPSVIGFENWLDKPAGKHGGVRMKGSQFVFEDGTPVKFWGTNLSYREGAPEKQDADLTAARFAKWGVNAVRLHKPFGPGWEGIGDEQDGTRLTAKGLDQMDYFMAKLKEHGVYYGFSRSTAWGCRAGVRRTSSSRLPAAGRGGTRWATSPGACGTRMFRPRSGNTRSWRGW